MVKRLATDEKVYVEEIEKQSVLSNSSHKKFKDKI